ncbi:hypothetical protein MOQ_003882, partial [Trypanosoma cruzi marinkellei]
EIQKKKKKKERKRKKEGERERGLVCGNTYISVCRVMSAWKRGPYPVDSRGGGGKWASHRNYPRRFPTHEDYEDDDKRHSHHHNRNHHHHRNNTNNSGSGSGNIGGGMGGAVKRPGSRHGRRRERSYSRREVEEADNDNDDDDYYYYDGDSDVSMSNEFGDNSNYYDYHRRRKRQRRESSYRRHRHRHRSSSSSRRRDSHRPHHQQEESQQGDDALQSTGRRRQQQRWNEEDYSKSSHAMEVERRQKQLLSALDRQLATYQRRVHGEGDESKDGSSKKTHQDGQEEGCGGFGRTLLPSSRVVLYGVDLGVQPCHLNSMLEQLVGRRPLSVFRPAAELRQSLCDTASTGVGNLPEVPSAGFGSDCSPHLGLHDVDGAGGVVVMELPRDGDTVAAAVAALNGAYVNGRIIGAVVHS